jgi:hypothetical protein
MQYPCADNFMEKNIRCGFQFKQNKRFNYSNNIHRLLKGFLYAAPIFALATSSPEMG